MLRKLLFTSCLWAVCAACGSAAVAAKPGESQRPTPTRLSPAYLMSVRGRDLSRASTTVELLAVEQLGGSLLPTRDLKDQPRNQSSHALQALWNRRADERRGRCP